MKQGTFTIQVGDAKLEGRAPATGDWAKFENVRLGSIAVAVPGPQAVKVVPKRGAWAAMNLAWLELVVAGP